MNVLSLACTAFVQDKQLISGPLVEVALAVKNYQDKQLNHSVLVFNDENGKVVDLDLRGDKTEMISRLLAMKIDNTGYQTAISTPTNKLEKDNNESDTNESDTVDTPKRGRPKLGVVGKEVTLLPRHWDWLATQPGGASVVLRKLVEKARKSDLATANNAVAQEKAYRFMSAMAGDLPDFEEASRALFAMDMELFRQYSQNWSHDIVAYVLRLLGCK